ncbi:MAG: hypothetical protein IJ620_01545 [Bacteroidales bacterium]|nr:hypothetical protein [Bacteroidales bacterium]
MKLKYLMMATLLGVAMSSCVKDDDFKEVKEGNLGISLGDISFGMPIGSSDLNAGGLLQKWQGAQCEILYENNVLTLKYEDTIENTVSFAPNSKKSTIVKGRKSDPVFQFDTIYRQEMTGELDIDMFANFPNLENFELVGLKANLSVLLKANMSANTSNQLAQYIDDPYITGLTISTTGADNTLQELPIPAASRTFTASQLSSEQGVKIPIYENSASIDDLIQSRPKKMSYRLTINVPIHITYTLEDFIANGGFPTYFNDIVNLSSFYTKTYISAKFPLRIKCNDLIFTDTINDVNLPEIKKALNEATDKIAYGSTYYLAVKFTNSIPMSFTTNDRFLDSQNNTVTANGKVLHLFVPDFVIPSAPLQDPPTTIENETYYYSGGKTSKHMLVPLTKEDIESIQDASRLVLEFKLNTPENAPSVSLREDDRLITDIYLLVNPSDEIMSRFNN